MSIYKYIDTIINVFLMIFNFFSRIASIFNLKLRKLLINNRNARNIRKSDECFILGNGPSIKKVDLSQLNDKETFTVNYFYKYNTQFKSKFFIAIDDAFAHTEGLEYIRKVYEENPDIIMFLRYNCFFIDKSFFDTRRTFFLYAKQFQVGNDVRFECDKNMTACINVVLQAIQIAIYMGYKRIYLLGCDFSEYAQIKIEHFYEANLPRGYSMGDEARWAALAHYHHYALDRYAKEHGVEIVNLTEGSLIDAYRRDSLENVLK